ncbi:desaturase-related protein [Mycobacterium tuberculosis BT1]|nr:desaturase-related protein [Mycobacterium tuberculosis BT1]
MWVYNGRAYDLSEWISKHPGGAFFIGRTKNRDITAIVKSYHRDPAIVERILQRRYALGRDATPRDIHPKHNAPAFLFKDDFNSWRDTPKYRFDDPNDLLHRVKARLAEPALAARIKRMDTLFNAIVAVLAVGYFAVQGVRLVEPSWMPLWAFVIAMVLLRSSLAGFGHYALHRAQRGLLSEWISKHPGGAFFIGRTKNRDITAIVKSYHRDPAIVERILQRRYALGRDATPRDIHPKHNAPAFLFKDDFNSWRDTPKYRFDDPNDLLHRVKARLAEPALAARIKRMDTLFNAIVAVLAVGYFAVQGVRLVEPSWMPLWAFVIAMVLLRSSLAGFGHYALHRAQRGEPPR